MSIRMPSFTFVASEVALQSSRRESRAARLGLGADPLVELDPDSKRTLLDAKKADG